MSTNERDQDSANTGDMRSTHDEEQGGSLEKREEETAVETNKEQIEEVHKKEENKGDQEQEDLQREEAERQEYKTNEEDVKERKEDAVNEQAVYGAFLQVSEPALVSAHHDGFLRFWNLSVSF